MLCESGSGRLTVLPHPNDTLEQGYREVVVPERRDKDGILLCTATTTKQRGVHVPKVLRPYIGTDFLPFVRDSKKVTVMVKKVSTSPTTRTERLGDGAIAVPTIDQMNSVLASRTFLEGATKTRDIPCFMR